MRTASIWAFVALATTTPMRVNSPVLSIPAAATASRAAAIEEPCTITVVLPVRVVSWRARNVETSAAPLGWSAAEAVPPTANVAEAARTLAVQASRGLRRTGPPEG